MEAAYRTLAKPAQSELVINKSRFIGAARPVQTEEDALALIADEKRRHPQANHHCYAYVIGRTMGVQPYSDDGEPQGTAGQPILGAIAKPSIVNAAVVVTRYFGGVLLGAGGLVRAYTAAASAAISEAGIAVMEPTVQLALLVDYSMLGPLTRALESLPVIVEDKDFGADVTLTVLTRARDRDTVLHAVTQATDGRCEALELGEAFRAWEDQS